MGRRRAGLGPFSLAGTALAGLGLCAAAMAQPAQVAPATPGTLAARIAAARDGETILLASGSYGLLDLDNRKLSGAGLTIQADAGARPVFSAISAIGSEGLTIKNVEVDIEKGNFGVTVANSDHISLVSLKIYAPPGNAPNGMMLRNDHDVAVTDSDLNHLGNGINLVDNDRVQILRNTLSEIESDGIRGASSHVDVIGNHGSNFHPAPGDHPDFIQFWDTREGPSTGNRIQDNVFERGHGDPVQGIFIEGNRDLVISGNVLLGTMFNAVAMAGVQGAVVEDNFIQNYPDMGSMIITRGPSWDVTVRNNVAPQIVDYKEGGKPNPNYKEQGNRLIKAAKPGDTSAMQAWLAKRQAR
jgi:hypothetical protein